MNTRSGNHVASVRLVLPILAKISGENGQKIDHLGIKESLVARRSLICSQLEHETTLDQAA
jgi:hypothetical protein